MSSILVREVGAEGGGGLGWMVGRVVEESEKGRGGDCVGEGGDLEFKP